MRPEKTLLLEGIKKGISNSTALIFATYDRMNPNLAAAFRMNVGKTGANFAVVKKRILLKAAEKAGLTLDRANLTGHVGVIFTENDPVQTTKYVYQFRKENAANFNVLGGRFEGVLCSAQDVEQISQLPGRDEMRAQLLGLLEAPMSQTLAVFEALLSSVIYCLDNKVAESEEKSDLEN